MCAKLAAQHENRTYGHKLCAFYVIIRTSERKVLKIKLLEPYGYSISFYDTSFCTVVYFKGIMFHCFLQQALYLIISHMNELNIQNLIL